MSTQYEVRSGGYQASFLVQTTDHKKVGWLSIRDLKDRERPMCIKVPWKAIEAFVAAELSRSGNAQV